MFYKEIDIRGLVHIARKAGDAIMQVYQSGFEVERKADYSPVTEADKKANKVILDSLIVQYPNIHYISEETKQSPYSERKNWQRLWLIDPLDGTKEFIKKNGEFTVNIALIEDGIPVVGVVHVPATNVTYVGIKGEGAYKISSLTEEYATIHAGAHYNSLQNIKVVGSRSHLSTETLEFVDELKTAGKQVEFVSSGSSLKFCLIAEGVADVYPRFGPTMEWDTAAAHAVVLYAGKNVLNYDTRQQLTYNREDLLNPWFIVE